MINTPSSTNSSSLDKFRANLVSLLWQAAGVFLIFILMLVLAARKPSGWMLPITFLIAGGFVVWAEAKREHLSQDVRLVILWALVFVIVVVAVWKFVDFEVLLHNIEAHFVNPIPRPPRGGRRPPSFWHHP